VGAIAWGCCISSDLARAVATAKAAFAGPVECTSLLREPEFLRFQTGRLRLPVWAWRCLMGLAWMTGHKSQRSCRDDFLGRVSAVADAIEGRNEDVLVVSHAGMMAYLSRELRRRGFHGPSFRIAVHAKLYVFERR
jgi:broad specificity phosphatase PhoE